MRTHRVRSVRPQEGKRQRSLIGTVERMPLCGSPTAGTKQKEQLVLFFFVCQGGREPTLGEMSARPKGLALRRRRHSEANRRLRRLLSRGVPPPQYISLSFFSYLL